MSRVRQTYTATVQVDFKPPEGYFEEVDRDGYSQGWFKHEKKSAVFFASRKGFPKAPQRSSYPLVGYDCIIMMGIKALYATLEEDEFLFSDSPVLKAVRKKP